MTAELILRVMAEAAGMEAQFEGIGLHEEEVIERRSKLAPVDWQRLLLGEANAVRYPALEQGRAGEGRRAVFPGAYNPRHEGHRRMAAVAAEMLEMPVEHEISIANVDKPPLDYLEMDGRLGQFGADEPVWFTRAPRFVDKATIFPGATFVVGADTIRRIADPKYYDDCEADRDAAVRQLTERGRPFLVFGRAEQGQFKTLSDLDLPQALASICQEVPAERFREDISSTELRRQAADAAPGAELDR